MKKLLAMLLIATMLVASVTCALAVSAEEAGTTTETDSNILVNLMPGESETDNYKIVKNDDGSVTITLKTAGTDAAPVKVEWTYAEGTAFTVTEDAPAAVVVLDLKANGVTAIDDFNSNNTSITYDRKNHTGTGDLHFLNDDVKKSKKEGTASTSYSFDVGTYLENHTNKDTNEKDYYNEDHKYNVSKAVVTLKGEANSSVTIYTLAVVKSTEGLTFGEGKPLVKPATTDPDPDEGDGKDDPTPDDGKDDDKTSDGDSAGSATTPAESSSTAPGTGDTGMIVFAVLAVLAVVGGVAVVRVRR